MKLKKLFIDYDPYKLQERLRDLRADKDGIKRLTQEDVGKAIGRNRQTISKYEKGKQTPSLSDIVRLAQLYECSIYYLLGMIDEKRPFELADIQ